MAGLGFIKVAEISELSHGEMKSVALGQEELLLANVGGNFYVIGNTCTHAMGPLSEGDLSEEQVECPLHGAKFSVITGEVLNPPAGRNVHSYEVRISGQDILVGPAQEPVGS